MSNLEFVSRAWLAHCAHVESEKRKQEEIIREWKEKHDKKNTEAQKQEEIDLAWHQHTQGY